MKKIYSLVFLLLILSSYYSSAAIVRIYARHNSEGVTIGYDVKTLSGEDQSEVTVKYTIQDFDGTFLKLIDKNEVGTQSKPDRIVIEYNEDGALFRITCQTIAKQTYTAGLDPKEPILTGTIGSFEEVVKIESEVTQDLKTDAEALKIDVETKMGKTIDGKDK